MKRIKVKLIGTGIGQDAFRVNLPTYRMDVERDIAGNIIIANAEEGLGGDSCNYVKKECYVLVPDNLTKEVMGKTVLDQDAIRTKYEGIWSKFKASNVEL